MRDRQFLPKTLAPSPQSPAFTLIEMIVVVAIIGLLLAIAVPGSIGLVNSQKTKATKLTMQTLETAINTFAAEKPIAVKWYADRFGAFPPSPVTSFELQANLASFNTYGPSAFDRQKDEPLHGSFIADPGGTKWKFEQVARNYLVPLLPPSDPNYLAWDYNYDSNWRDREVPETDKYISIEMAVLFMRQLSPQCRQTIDRMQKNLSNKDGDKIWWDSDGDENSDGQTMADLLEINDAWGNPIRYAVQSPVTSVISGNNRTLKIRWELRSAGPDGMFNPTFGPALPGVDGAFVGEEFAGDDVILRGP